MEKELKLNILVPQISTSKDELNQTKNKNWKPKKHIPAGKPSSLVK